MEARYIAFWQTIRMTARATWKELMLQGAPVTVIDVGDFLHIKAAVFKEYWSNDGAWEPLLAEIVEGPENATHVFVKVPYKSYRIYAISEFEPGKNEDELIYVRRRGYELSCIMRLRPIRG